MCWLFFNNLCGYFISFFFVCVMVFDCLKLFVVLIFKDFVGSIIEEVENLFNSVQTLSRFFYLGNKINNMVK